MQTRKDLYQAYRLTTQRVALALLQGRPSAAESPLRRTGVGTLCGVMVAVLIAAGFGISGLIFKGGAGGLERPGVLVIEKETGASYAYSAETRRMVPFVNYASARLAMPDASIQRRSVSSRSLAKYARGPLTGIEGAPESLPDPARLGRGPWSLCVRTVANGAAVVSLVGGRDVGGRGLSDGEAVLVRAGGRPWLVWHDRRMRISVEDARALTAEEPVLVDARWLNGLPQGPDFTAPSVPGWGSRAPGPDGAPTPVGQVFEVAAVAGTPARWYVQLRDGLSSISQTQARLLLEAAGTRPDGPGQVRVIPPGVAAARPSRTNLHSDDLPEDPPRPIGYASSVPLCVVYRGTDKLSMDARFTVGATLPAMTGNSISAGLDQVVISGGGTFAGTLALPGHRPQAYALITDQGVRYPVATAADVAKLGYSMADAAPVPANLMQLFRDGPVLASDAARRPVPAR
ncbi:type VII secretion protein EccB [Actinomadura rayongensis]|uniref:Type VII secretion protein EccB n=1 Tax=Actinomadura rayongensis TaxID=1429076 RepID=A0A6I4W4G0_9ACTN|nr:type VII secretion protein EccB [Actinomadura rayongensis]MXQ64328.1 type VII secretion protein EccB [Actinomadura rayongensis]